MRKLNLTLSFFLCGAASFLALHKLNYPLIGIDDANIYFVYARNLANGYGFVYNIGGEKVEGFTSLLWTLISALAFKFSAAPELTLLIINVILVSLGIAYALGYLQHDLSGKENKRETQLFWSALFLILVFTSPRYIVWNTITLMENALWSTLLLGATIFVIRDQIYLRVINFGFIPLSILLLLTRPESILWVVVFGTVLFLRLASTGNFTYALKALTPAIICIVLTLALLTLFRLQYFGYPLPNTYYAKVSPSITYNLEQGAIYLIRYFISDPIATISVTAVFLACLYSVVRVSPHNGAFYLPIIAATSLLIPLLTGGDHFGSFRFYQNVYPITTLCLIYFSKQLLSEMTRSVKYSDNSAQVRVVLSVSLALILGYAYFLTQVNAWSHFSSEIDAEFKVAEYERRNGAFIQELFSSLPSLPSIGVIASGGIKYSYDGEIVDLLGLNNTTMAHNHGDRTGYKNHAAFEVTTLYELQPDIVWPLNVDEGKWKYSEAELQKRWENVLGFKGLFNDSRFLELYVYAKVSRKSESRNGTALVAWFKKDFLKSVVANVGFLVEEYQYAPSMAKQQPKYLLDFTKLRCSMPSQISQPSFRC